MEPWADQELITDWRNLPATEALLQELHRLKTEALKGLRVGARQGDQAKASNEEGQMKAYENVISLITVTDAR